MRSVLRATFLQSIFILVAAAGLGILVDLANPKGILRRPRSQHALQDSLLFAVMQDSTIVLQAPPRISTAAVRRLLANPSIVLLDARAPADYLRGHIPGALNLPYEELYRHAQMLEKIDPRSWIVCYCDGPPCDLGERLAGELFAAGLPRVAVYEGGINEWRREGGQIETGSSGR
jgi:rhodanese-related sulfurtransferase